MRHPQLPMPTVLTQPQTYPTVSFRHPTNIFRHLTKVLLPNSNNNRLNLRKAPLLRLLQLLSSALAVSSNHNHSNSNK